MKLGDALRCVLMGSLGVMACKTSPSSQTVGNSHISSVEIGTFTPPAEGKAWDKGRILFIDTSTKKPVFTGNLTKGSSKAEEAFLLPYGTYWVRVKYFAQADAKNPIYIECLDKDAREKVYSIQQPTVNLDLEVCTPEQVQEAMQQSSTSAKKTTVGQASSANSSPVKASGASFEARVQSAETILSGVQNQMAASSQLSQSLTNLKSPALSTLKQDKSDLSLSYFCKQVSKFQQDVTGVSATELEAAKKSEALRLLASLMEKDQLCESTYSLDRQP